MERKRADVVNIEVVRAMRRPADVVFTVEFWRLHDGRWWHAPYALSSCIGTLDPVTLRTLAHAIVEDGNDVWDHGGSPRPPSRKKVKARRKGWSR